MKFRFKRPVRRSRRFYQKAWIIYFCFAILIAVLRLFLPEVNFLEWPQRGLPALSVIIPAYYFGRGFEAARYEPRETEPDLDQVP